jgi:hypothetical protein
LTASIFRYLSKIRFFPSGSDAIQRFIRHRELELVVVPSFHRIIISFSGCKNDSYGGKKLVSTKASRFFALRALVHRLQRSKAAEHIMRFSLSAGSTASLVVYFFSVLWLQKKIADLLSKPRSQEPSQEPSQERQAR